MPGYKTGNLKKKTMKKKKMGKKFKKK